jgi:hypothetical protein
MAEYKPKVRRPGMKPNWGYFVSASDPKLLLPNPQMLDALHYAFRMKAKHKTPIRHCTQWLHAATGQLMTPSGFNLAYKRWLKNLKKENRKEVNARKKAILDQQQAYVDENMKHLTVIVNDADDIAALAHKEAQEQWKAKEQGTG